MQNMESQINNNTSSINEKIEKWNHKLISHKISIGDTSLRDNKNNEYISNFVLEIVEQIIYEDEIDPIIRYKVKAILLEEKAETEPIEISVEELNSFNFILKTDLARQCVIGTKPSYKATLRKVAQIISKDTMKVTKKYTNTGMTEIEGQPAYLYHGGCISLNETNNIKADLSTDELDKYNFTSQQCELVNALALIIEMLSVAPAHIIFPIIATVFLSPLISWFAEEGIYADYVLMLVGKSGSRKSSLAALALNFFGDQFHRNNLPANFKNTENSIEKKAYTIKDSLLVVDDYRKEKIGRQALKIIEKLLGIYGDRQGRTRMNIDCRSLRKTYTARGTCLVTAEVIPDSLSESRLYRSIIVNIKKDDVNNEILTKLQNNNYMLAVTMKNYIGFVITNKQLILTEAKQIMHQLQQNQNNDFHGRSNEAINVMYIAFRIFIKFMIANKMIPQEDEDLYLKKAYSIFINIVKNQAIEVEETDMVKLFYNAVSELKNAGRINFIDYKTGAKLNTTGKIVGYIDKAENLYYFHAQTIYDEVKRFYINDDNKFNISKCALQKELQAQGKLYMTDPSRKTVFRTDVTTGEEIKVLAVYIEDIADTSGAGANAEIENKL